jgi:glycosyltransferase involved in cell wall biosynthesis
MQLTKARQSTSFIQLVIAALNEEQGIGATIAEMQDTLGEISTLVVDGNSDDKTAEIAKNMGAKVICQDGKGKGDALSKALKNLDATANYIILTDADYTYPAEYVPEMIEILDTHPEVGMVCGNRFNGHVKRRALHRIFHIGNRMIAFAHKVLNDVELNDPLTGLRVIRVEAVRDLDVKSEGFDIEVELNNYIKSQGYDISEILIDYRERRGKKKLKARDGFSILKRIIKDAF